jgi:histidinol-phosphate/aromatic aminotransferase/cobyric acid decarboxylase-like protein
VRPDTRVVFIANPGNPTGTRIPREELLWLRDALPRDVLLVIDEAYGEFADHLNEPMFDLVDRGDTVVLRTFSKAFGLAGFRVGWGAFPPDAAGELRKVTNPNTVGAPAQAAAQAALADQAYMRDTCRLTADLRDGFIARLRPSGFDVPDSFANFALIRFATDEQAGRADRALRQEGVFLRPQGGVGLGACLRATIGAARDLDTAAEILENFARKEMP